MEYFIANKKLSKLYKRDLHLSQGSRQLLITHKICYSFDHLLNNSFDLVPVIRWNPSQF